MTDASGGAAAGAPQSFETAFERLKQIVEALESGENTLDESLKLFEEGISLVRICNAELERAESKIRILCGFDGEKAEFRSFEPEAENGGRDSKL